MTAEDLTHHLSCWNRLNDFFQTDPSRDDLLTLLDMERKGKRRTFIIQRLTARLATVEKELRRKGKL